MSGSEAGAAPSAERTAWLRELRRVDERQEDALAGDFDAQWGEIEPMHHTFVERFLSRLPPDGRVLDAACGTRKYFPIVLASGRRLRGVDHAGALLAKAAAKFPQVPTAKHDLQELLNQGEFDGVLCVDTMEFVPPEEWPPVLERFRRALRLRGWLSLTVELAPDIGCGRPSRRPAGRGFRWWMARSSGRNPTGTPTTTRTWGRCGSGLPVPGSPSRRRPRVHGTRRGIPITTCWPVSRPKAEDVIVGTWIGRDCRCRKQPGLQRITWPSTFADHQGKQRSAWHSAEDC
jgi:SAM-dependent methyltransferase